MDGLELSTEGREGNRLVAIVGPFLQPRQELPSGKPAIWCSGEEEKLLRILERQRTFDHVTDGDRGNLVDAFASGRTRAREDRSFGPAAVLAARSPGRSCRRWRSQGDRPVRSPAPGSRRRRPGPSPAIESGVEPSDAPTPRLSKVITRCFAAMPSTTLGSQLSKTAAQVVEEDHWHAGVRTELPVGEFRSADIDHLGRRVLVCTAHRHRRLLPSRPAGDPACRP